MYSKTNLGQDSTVKKAGIGFMTILIVLGSIIGLTYYLEPGNRKKKKKKYRRKMTRVYPLPR